MPSIQLVATVVALALTSGLATAAEAPFDFDKASGRLPKNVVPLDYDLAVVPDAAARTFTGTESVSLKFRTATDKVVFNTLNLTLSNVRLDGHSWLKAHVRAEMGPQIEKGMEGARFRLTQKQALVPEADAYLAARAPHA